MVKNNMKKENIFKGKWMIGLAVAIIIITISAAIISRFQNSVAVAYVNGEPVTALEFSQEMAENKSKVYDYFRRKYNAQEDKNFWETAYNGEVPVQMLKKMTLDDLIEIKVEQILGKQNGLLSDTRYNVFLKVREQENKKRAKAKENGEVIYGPVEYGEREYFHYVHSNMVIQLKELLIAKELDIKAEMQMESNREKLKNGMSEQALEAEIIDTKYGELVNSRIKNAGIKINEFIYNRLNVS